MKNIYGRLKIVALILLILGLYVLLVQTALAKTRPPNKIIQTTQIEVTGTVTDANGVLPGVNVTVKNQAVGTITNFDGEYALNVQPNDTLVFSYIGYNTLTEPVNGRATINVQLKEDATALKHVVINAGYYNTTKRESTGSVSRITAEEIELQPLVSPLQAMQGRMAGVQILSASNRPGAAPIVRIRGQNSLRPEGNYPLYIIDGVPISSTPLASNTNIGYTGIDPLSTLNPANIQSIEVLKDADATAIYGSRGANGVILITTKKGKGQKGIQARIYTGAATVPNKLDLLKTSQYLQIRKMAFQNDGVEPDEENAYDLLLWDQNRYTDWQEYFLGGTSNITNINISGSGGNEQTSFRLNGSLHKQGTIYPADLDYRRLTGSFSLRHRSKDEKLVLNLIVNYGIDDNKLLGDGVDFRGAAFELPPNAPNLFTADGKLNWEEWGEAGLNNPLEGFFNVGNIQTHNLVTNFNFSYELLSGLRLKTNMGYTYYNSEELLKMPKHSYNPLAQLGHMSLSSNTRRTSWIVEPQLHYKKQWGKLELKTLVGATVQEDKTHLFSIAGYGYVAETLIGNLAAAESLLNANGADINYRYRAVFGRIGLNWNEKYLLNLTGRRDGSSRFGPGKRFSNFGALGTAWIFTEEDFFKDQLTWLSFGKLRASYGTTGNDQIPNYGYLAAYAATPGPGGLYPIRLANPDYSWEINKKLDVALRLGLFKNRVNLGINWYRNRSDNQLVGYPLPATTGFSSIQANLNATVENRGWEVELFTENIRKGNFRWQTSLNVSFPQNELVRYPQLEQSPYKNMYQVGKPLNIAWLYQYEGLDPETGLYTVKDVNEDGDYDFQDRVVIQERTRQYFGGINNNLSYKGFSLRFLWQFVKQEGTFARLFKAGFPENQIAEVASLLEGGTTYQQPSQTTAALQAYYRAVGSDFVIEDASYLRLKTLSFSYDFSLNTIQKLGLEKLRVFVTGQNLVTITDYPGMDPAMPTGGTSFANLRIFSAGMQLNF